MNLSSSYLGLDLRNPLVASAGPMTQTADRIERLAEVGTDSFGEATSYLIDPDASLWPRQYLDLVQRAAKPGIPVIASLNGSTPGGWTGYARAMQDAGAAAIELNIYYLPGDPPPGSASPFASGPDAEQRYVDILTAVKSVVSVPVAVKVAPYFSSLGDMALRLERAGADGLVLFNRFMQTDIDPETLTVSTGFKLSSPAEATLSRSWIARLRGQVRSSLAASTGVETADDVAAYLLAGADAVMTTSALLRGRDPRAARRRHPAAARAVRLPQRGRTGHPGPFLPVAPGAPADDRAADARAHDGPPGAGSRARGLLSLPGRPGSTYVRQ